MLYACRLPCAHLSLKLGHLALKAALLPAAAVELRLQRRHLGLHFALSRCGVRVLLEQGLV